MLSDRGSIPLSSTTKSLLEPLPKSKASGEDFFIRAIEEATRKKKTDVSKVAFLTYDEGLCVQCMHIGSYDDRPATVE